MAIEKDIIDCCRVVAVVGLSPNTDRPSYHVAKYLKEQGFKVIPVNPSSKEILSEVCYPNLESIPDSVDVVDVFRRSEDTPAIVEEAIKIGARAVWMQEGVVNEDAANRAKQAGLMVVMDRCMLKEHMKIKRNAQK